MLKVSDRSAEMSQPVSAATAVERRSARYLLIILTLFYTSSFVDRAILNILAQPIKEDMGLTDGQLGILGGIAFALVYALFGIPIARLAERKNRVTIISVALAIWSGMTVFCGLAANFAQLVIGRAGVGIGEAACTPCAHSMIADSFPAARRATAMSVYSLGIPFGTLLGTVGGAWVAELYGWRAAFMAVGAPGLLLALLAKLTISEPQRGRFDASPAHETPSIRDVLAHLFARRTFIHLLIGLCTATMISAGIGAFAAPFMLRGDFGLDLTDVAWLVAALTGLAAIFGTLSGGIVSDRLLARHPRYYLRLPAIGFFLAGPLFAAAFLQESVAVLFALSAVAQILCLVYLGPSFGALHNMVRPRMRATAIAAVFMLTSLIGLGLGPILVGELSDLSAAYLIGAEAWRSCAISMESAVCRSGSFGGVRLALVAASLLYIWPALHYWLAARTFAADMEAA